MLRALNLHNFRAALDTVHFIEDFCWDIMKTTIMIKMALASRQPSTGQDNGNVVQDLI